MLKRGDLIGVCAPASGVDPARLQAGVELFLYITFFFPGILALSIAGWHYAYDSFRIREMSINSPIGIPIWQIKMMIPVGAALLSLQGLAECMRCIICLQENRWPPRLHDVEELEQQLMKDRAAGVRQAVGGAQQ